MLASGAVRAEGAAQGDVTLDVTISGLKSDKGVVRLAICPPQAGFPDCKSHAVRSAAVGIVNDQARVIVTGLAPGTYAVSVFHDANDNGKLDTFVGIPREGYGFSGNPPFRPRAPRFDEAEMNVAGKAATTIRMRYIL